VVKFADTPKDKETKKIQQQFTNQNPNLMQQIASGNPMVRSSNTLISLSLISELLFR
jgi:hypothetical protein